MPKAAAAPAALPKSIDATLSLLASAGYVGDRQLATVLFLALKMGRPLFLEGEAGVGKTEIAKVLAQALEPAAEGPPVLLIDELDRTDAAFEAFLLEVLSDFQITIPELGTVKAAAPPIVIITSNRTREIHDALKRRCLYHWLDYPDAARETAIVRAKAPGIPAKLTEELVAFVQAIRKEDLFKSPGVAETLDWAAALTELDAVALDPAQVSDTLGVLLKYQDDISKMQGSRAAALIDEVRAGIKAR